jgi:hypothetical protein
MNWIVLSGAGIFVAFWLFLLIKGKWFITDWPQWARISSMLAIAAMMFALIWYMNSEAEKVELVWATGDAEITWDKGSFPLKVAYDPDIAKDVAKATVKLWNRDHCDLFVLAGTKETADVYMERGSYREKSPLSGNELAGSTWQIPGTMRFIIRIHEPGGPTHEYLILGHEGSHVLGLAHDDDPRFITSPGAYKHTDLSKMLPHPSRKDSTALKNRYCD